MNEILFEVCHIVCCFLPVSGFIVVGNFVFFPSQKKSRYATLCQKRYHKHQSSVSSRIRRSLDRSRHADMNNSRIAEWLDLSKLQRDNMTLTHQVLAAR
jgi:hypothetical protein